MCNSRSKCDITQAVVFQIQVLFFLHFRRFFFCITFSYKELLSIEEPKCKYRGFSRQAVRFPQALPKAVPATDQNFFGLLFICICSQAMSVI